MTWVRSLYWRHAAGILRAVWDNNIFVAVLRHVTSLIWYGWPTLRLLMLRGALRPEWIVNWALRTLSTLWTLFGVWRMWLLLADLGEARFSGQRQRKRTLKRTRGCASWNAR